MKARVPNKNLFDFNPKDMAKVKNTLKSTWELFRNSLANNEFSYSQTEKALETVFLKQFDQLFQICGKTVLSTYLEEIFSNYCIGRGTVLRPNEPTPYSRFIPMAEFIKDDNRFSPPKVEWLYLVIGNTDEHIKHCSEAECRAEKGNRFGFCHFKLNSSYADVRIVDLTKLATETYDKINADLEISTDSKTNKILEDIIASGNISSNNIKATILQYNEALRNDLTMWFLKTYSTMLSELIFVPIEDSQKKLEYTPFQTMAKYFEKQGFGGIVYKSTKYPHAKNLVLFDKNYAKPHGSIDDYII